jgi:hypothetical protein
LKIGIALDRARRAMFNNNTKDLKSMIKDLNRLSRLRKYRYWLLEEWTMYINTAVRVAMRTIPICFATPTGVVYGHMLVETKPSERTVQSAQAVSP